MSINNTKENPFFGKTHSPDVIKKLRERMTGQNNPMYGKSNRGRKSIIVETHSEPIYLYDSNTLSYKKVR